MYLSEAKKDTILLEKIVIQMIKSEITIVRNSIKLNISSVFFSA